MKKILFLIFIFVACKDKLPIIQDMPNNYQFLSSDSTEVIFPNEFKGKIIVLGLIFTNCPDICPLTTNNMRLIQEEVKKRDLDNVEFVAISFDPKHDTPEVLRNYIRIRDFDTSNWKFLTGNQSEIDKLLEDIGFFAIPSDTIKTVKGEMVTFIHTDRISLIDSNLKIRKNYPGSTINIEEIINDIQNL